MYEPQTCYYVIALAGPELPPAGFCFSGSSTVTRLVKKDASDGPDHRASLEVEELPLTALSVGDQIQAMGHDGRKTWTTVTALPHSKSEGAFVDITVGSTGRKLSATEHHTFPNCKAGSGLHLMVPAHALKVRRLSFRNHTPPCTYLINALVVQRCVATATLLFLIEHRPLCPRPLVLPFLFISSGWGLCPHGER